MNEQYCPWLEFRQGKEIFLFRRTSGRALGPIQPPVQCLPLVKWSGCDVDFSPQSNAEIKYHWNYTSATSIYFLSADGDSFIYFITRAILGEEYRTFSSSLCSPLHSHVTSSLLGPNILLNTIFSNTLSFLSSLNVSDHVSHPYKTTGKIIDSFIYFILLYFTSRYFTLLYFTLLYFTLLYFTLRYQY